jgi:hypothetical protein
MRRIPVRIEGAWQPVAYVGQARWEGVATADEPITALALLRDDAGTRYARSGRTGASTLRLQLALFPADHSDSRYDVRLHFSIQPPGPGDSSGEASIQGIIRLTSTAPVIFALDHHVTGDPAWFARTWTAERIDLGALFVATADTRSARNHLWHLRHDVPAPTDFAAALAHGRTGLIDRPGQAKEI